MTRENYVGAADRALRETYEEPISLSEYVDRVFETPSIASQASKYLLEAIEHEGTRTVIEEGEERERYRFFDDPHNDGEHAVLGNTDVLNAFVDDLRSIASGRGKTESIVWFAGPTATGKSELKRCLINGLRAYSKTPEGRRYTIEWNVEGRSQRGAGGLTYGQESGEDEDDWHESPVQVDPLAVFPPAVRDDLLGDLNETAPDDVPIRVETDLDPFSREAYEHLEERYRREGRSDLFSAVTSEEHLRVKNVVVDVGRGIGVLHAEDEGRPKERLVGSWMPEMLQVLDSRGRKNPQAFSYDGVLAQGNRGLTIVEDASQHADLLQKLLNVPEEGRVKLDKGIGMDVDTQLIVISNPDLEMQLNQQAEMGGEDPLKALKRRLDRREFAYLTNLSLEVELLRRELADETLSPEVDAELDERIAAPLVMSVRTHEARVEREFAPHAIEAAALYDVVTRLDAEDLPGDLDLVEKALLYDRGYLLEDGERVEKDAFGFAEESADGRHGIPVTYTRDVLAGLLQTESDRSHPDLAVEHVVTPGDVLDAMAGGFVEAPVFAPGERDEFESRRDVVEAHVLDRQEADVLAAMLAEHRADEEAVAEYVEHVYAWATDEQFETGRATVDPDPLAMKVFEIEQLGRFDESDYAGTDPSEAVASFRREEIVTALNRQAWERRDEDFAATDVDFTEIAVLRDVLSADDWDDVRRAFEDFDPRQWNDPPAGTETARLKDATIDRLVEGAYSRASAELATRRVVAEVADEW